MKSFNSNHKISDPVSVQKYRDFLEIHKEIELEKRRREQEYLLRKYNELIKEKKLIIENKEANMAS